MNRKQRRAISKARKTALKTTRVVPLVPLSVSAEQPLPKKIHNNVYVMMGDIIKYTANGDEYYCTRSGLANDGALFIRR
jgi:hypothetical protein